MAAMSEEPPTIGDAVDRVVENLLLDKTRSIYKGDMDAEAVRNIFTNDILPYTSLEDGEYTLYGHEEFKFANTLTKTLFDAMLEHRDQEIAPSNILRNKVYYALFRFSYYESKYKNHRPEMYEGVFEVLPSVNQAGVDISVEKQNLGEKLEDLRDSELWEDGYWIMFACTFWNDTEDGVDLAFIRRYYRRIHTDDKKIVDMLKIVGIDYITAPKSRIPHNVHYGAATFTSIRL